MTEPAGWDCHVHVFDAAAPVRPGHYLPAHRPLHEIESLAARHGIGHLVLVQPSVYGTDNSVMLRALQASGGRHRGVAVLDAEASDAELDHLHAAGVRGVRFNLVSPAAPGGDVASTLRGLAPRLRERGWHAQWYVPPEMLPALPAWQAESGLVFVIDHLASLGTGMPDAHPAWAAAGALAAGGAWIKLSGWYRLGAHAPYAEVQPALARVLTLFGRRCVWGSDWPHTSFAPEALPPYASLLHPLHCALDAAGLAAVLSAQPAALYLD